ncbi:MAG: DUF1501 domain-containing protein [Planctomycetota bacterium]|jgi:uncharacterized protein (DUF1501 family)
MSHTRRDFLKASLGASGLAALGPAVPALAKAASAAPPRRNTGDSVLVVVQMAGGNDGLNTVVPYGDDEYHRNRPTLRAVADDVLKIDALVGFHPRMKAFKRLFDEGRLSVVQGTGYPNPNGDHGAAMRDWQTARPHETSCQTGWLGRAVDHVHRPEEAEVPAVFVGTLSRPLALNAEQVVVPSVRSLQTCTLRATGGAQDGGAGRAALERAAAVPRSANDNPLLGFLQNGTQSACGVSRRIEAILAGRGAAGGDYPAIQFAQRLRTVAQLVRADFGARIYYTELGGAEPGGFDNHANQLGNHCALLHQLSESVAAFADDLARDKLLDRVLLMTFSEFGRTVNENGRRGTGHASAAPMFLVGGKVKAGLIGPHPSLTELENGGPKHHTDFRRVYAAALQRWLGYDSRAALGQFEPLDVLEA